MAAGVLNIVVYPFTATAAIPTLAYRHAFVDRQVGFLISNVIPGGGAVAFITNDDPGWPAYTAATRQTRVFDTT